MSELCCVIRIRRIVCILTFFFWPFSGYWWHKCSAANSSNHLQKRDEGDGVRGLFPIKTFGFLGTHRFQLGRTHQRIIQNQICGDGKNTSKYCWDVPDKCWISTQTQPTFKFCFFLQIHANCRIRRIYFSDKLYCNEDLPKDFKLSFSEENQPTPSPYSIESAMKLSPVPGGHQGHRKGPSNRRTEPGSLGSRRTEPGSPSNRRTEPGSLSNRRTEPGSLTAARSTGSEHRRGFHTILDSVEKEPLKIWQKEVSVYIVHQKLLTTNIMTIVDYTLRTIN